VGEGKTKEGLRREFSAGGIVFKDNASSWLIIKPAGTDRWQLPKGLIDEGESSKEAALREVEEEGGIKAQIMGKVGEQRYVYYWEGKKVFKTVVYFLMKYISGAENGHDHEVDEALFLPFEEAVKKLTFEKDKEFLKKGKELFKQGIQENLI